MTKSRVAVIYEPGKKWPKPQWFTYEGKKVSVMAINYCWETNEGDTKILRYSVSTDAIGIYELDFNTKDLSWVVREVERIF